MTEVRWDAMAALIALIGLPLMLSGSTAWLINIIIRRFKRAIWRHGSTCERLEWRDIPDGPLRDNNPAQPNRHGDHETHYFYHDEKKCLDSTVGTVFQYAWISAHRRDRRVFKPYQLDPARRYVRTDRKTLEAFVLLSPGASLQFKEMDGVLTAHLSLVDHSELHNRTKEDIDMILRGYPPFYQGIIDVSDTVKVRSPISSLDDVTRGGWIVAVGLDFHRRPPLATHNMDVGYALPQGWDGVRRREWMSTSMVYAVRRFGEVLQNIQASFPDDNRAKRAIRIFSALTTGEIDLDQYTSPFEQLYFEVLEIGGAPWIEGEYRSLLSKDQWEQAMGAFNHRDPLTPKEERLFADFMAPILQAAITGLIYVFTYQHYRARRSAKKLPLFPELQVHKHIYLTACEAGLDEDC